MAMICLHSWRDGSPLWFRHDHIVQLHPGYYQHRDGAQVVTVANERYEVRESPDDIAAKINDAQDWTPETARMQRGGTVGT